MAVNTDNNVSTMKQNKRMKKKEEMEKKRKSSRRSGRALTVQNGKVVRKDNNKEEGEKKKKKSGFFLFRRSSNRDVDDVPTAVNISAASSNSNDTDQFDAEVEMPVSKEHQTRLASSWRSLGNMELSERPTSNTSLPVARLGSKPSVIIEATAPSDSSMGGLSSVGSLGVIGGEDLRVGGDDLRALTKQIAELGATTQSLHTELQRVKDRLKDKRSIRSNESSSAQGGNSLVEMSAVHQHEREARRSRGGADPPALKRGMSFGSMMDLVYKDDDTIESDGGATVDEFLTPSRLGTVETTAKAVFPGLIPGDILAKGVETVLSSKAGYDKKTTLLATSLCCDEVNREFEESLRNVFGYNFSMGGLAGFAFGGVTSFGAMAHHIPSNGSCLIVYGPHVGIDVKGTVGKLNRVGRYDHGSGACCGSATAAHAYCRMVSQGDREARVNPDDYTDAQQVWVGSALLKHAKRLDDSRFPEVELPHALFDCQDDLMQKIVQRACGEVAGRGKIALLGGIQINTPSGLCEYFVPQKFQVFNNKGELHMNLMEDLRDECSRESSEPVSW